MNVLIICYLSDHKASLGGDRRDPDKTGLIEIHIENIYFFLKTYILYESSELITLKWQTMI